MKMWNMFLFFTTYYIHSRFIQLILSCNSCDNAAKENTVEGVICCNNLQSLKFYIFRLLEMLAELMYMECVYPLVYA